MKKLIQVIIISVLILACISISVFYATDKPSINEIEPSKLSVELQNIQGIGKVKSEAIVNYITKNKPIQIDDLDRNVYGIGEVLTKRIKEKFKE